MTLLLLRNPKIPTMKTRMCSTRTSETAKKDAQPLYPCKKPRILDLDAAGFSSELRFEVAIILSCQYDGHPFRTVPRSISSRSLVQIQDFGPRVGYHKITPQSKNGSECGMEEGML